MMKKLSLVFLCFLSLICLMTCELKPAAPKNASEDISATYALDELPERSISADATINKQPSEAADSSNAVAASETNASITTVEQAEKTELPQTTSAIDTPAITETAPRPDTTATSQTTAIPEIVIAPETTFAPETTRAPETTSPPQTMPAPETTVTPETTSALETAVALDTMFDHETIPSPQTTTEPEVTAAPEETTTLPETTAFSNDTAKADAGLKIVEMTRECVNGSMASLSVMGDPNTLYSISVYYSTQVSTAKGLEDKMSDESGLVTWTWKVGARTRDGEHKIVVEGGGKLIETYFATYKS